MRIGGWPARVINKNVRKQSACHPCCFFRCVSTSVLERVREDWHEASIVRRLPSEIVTLSLPCKEYRLRWQCAAVGLNPFAACPIDGAMPQADFPVAQVSVGYFQQDTAHLSFSEAIG